ncbi:sensor histidine kinase [Marinoscillum sp.]|uniref:sensor histidine kinase n=1 Tax=Marinoscillum sp. TaxID=2024838 RepID=UPI003BA8EE6B
MRWLKEKYIRWVGICIVAIIVMQFDDDHMVEEPLWYQYLVSWVFTAVYWNGAFLIFMMFRKLYPEINKTAIRLSWTYVVLFIWMSVGGVPVKLAFGLMELSDVFSAAVYLEFLAMNLVIALIVGTLYETVFFFEKWKEAIKLNEELKNQQLRTQFEVLQNQMSPHFLFNSLNTLTTLISENQEVATEFTVRLADVYRYILQNKERDLVTLEEEVQFAKDYVYLLSMRYPQNLHVSFEISPQQLKRHIAPLTLQMLIENCIKHNVISKANPLVVEVKGMNADSVMVKNNLKVKQALEKSTKTGLENIRKRYEYFGDRSIVVEETDEAFSVTVPLIEISQNKN